MAALLVRRQHEGPVPLQAIASQIAAGELREPLLQRACTSSISGSYHVTRIATPGECSAWAIRSRAT